MGDRAYPRLRNEVANQDQQKKFCIGHSHVRDWNKTRSATLNDANR